MGNKFNVGDKVKIVRKLQGSDVKGGTLTWLPQMDKNINKVGIVTDVSFWGNICVKTSEEGIYYYYPASLKKVFEKGDSVLLTHKTEDFVGGWRNVWNDAMQFNIGQTGVVEYSSETGIYVDFDDGNGTKFGYPPEALSLVETIPEPAIEEEMPDIFNELWEIIPETNTITVSHPQTGVVATFDVDVPESRELLGAMLDII